MAYMLGWTLHTLREEISHEEYLGWCEYFERQPYGWREDLRAYYTMAPHLGKKAKPEDFFPSIKQLREQDKLQTKEEAAAKLNKSFQASPFGAIFAEAMKKTQE